jgi:alpha-L-rhamnosidase
VAIVAITPVVALWPGREGSRNLREARHGWDSRGYDDTGWRSVQLVDVDMAVVGQRVAEPVREIGSWVVQPSAGPDGAVLLDGGQNIAGFVRLRVKGERDTEVAVRHAEVLNPDGSLHTHSLRTAEATDRYILAESGEVDLEPEFTFHGFRYATVETDAQVLGAQFVPISSDLERRGRFKCSHGGLNQLHENVVWSLRDNFVAIPTDCPQRDERLGWTGDAQAFVSTSATLVHGLQFWKSWLADLALDQDPVLGPPSVVPDVVLGEPMRYGRSGWADAATIVPWALYESYGDIDVLRDQFESMRSWVDSLIQRAGDDGLVPESRQFGDWLDPDAPGDKPWEAKVDSTVIANAFFTRSARILSDAARIVGHDVDVSELYSNLAERVAAATWDRWATHLVASQSGCAIALELGVVPRHERRHVAKALAAMVRRSRGRVSTGFLGTPLVLPALAHEGFYAEAYAMLLCQEMPSWLYQIDRGATTTWERWDAIRPDGTIHPGVMSPPPGAEEGGHMLSFNHYAYGSVIDWVYRHLGGIAPVSTDPGYRSVRLRPRPPQSIEWAETSIDSAYGEVKLSWSTSRADLFEAEIQVPFGVHGSFDGPLRNVSEQFLNGARQPGLLELGPGTHQVRIENPSLADTI